MVSIKIQCGCGQKYAFDIEPVDGRMPQAVNCPSCGANGTPAANEFITQSLAQTLPPPAAGRTAQTYTPPTRRKNKILVPVILAGGLVVAGAAWGVWFWFKSHKSESVAEQAVVVPNDGLPHTYEELNAWYMEPPEGQNGAKFFQQGLLALQITDANRKLLGVKMPDVDAPLPAATKKEIILMAKRNQPAMKFFEKGSQCKQSRYGIDLTKADLALLPHLAKLKQAAQISCLFATEHADAQQGNAAAQDVMTALNLGRSLDDEPLLISQLVRAACNTIAVQGLEQTVNRVSVPPESLKALDSRFQEAEAREASGEGNTRALVGERVALLAFAQTPTDKLIERVMPTHIVMTGGMEPPVTAEDRDNRYKMIAGIKTLKSDWPFFDQIFQLRMASRKEPFPDRLKTETLLNQRLTDAVNGKVVNVGFIDPRNNFAAKEANCLVRLRMGLTAIALERYRAAHENHYPASLKELTPDFLAGIPQDLFTSQPLRYETIGNGYELDSVAQEPIKPISFKVIKPPKAAASAAQSPQS